MAEHHEPQTAAIQGLFRYDGRAFPDPGAQFTPDEVREQLAQLFPDLINADVASEVKDGVQRVSFKKRIGTKGQANHQAVLAALHQVPEARLRVLDLATQAFDAEGTLRRQVDIDGGEFHLARSEAHACARRTEQVREALRQLPAR